MVQRNVSSVTSRAQTVPVAPRAGTTLWILQRLTSYGLLIFLAVHLYFTYFGHLDTASPLTFEVLKRPYQVYPFIYALNEGLLLVCALFHGLNGVRNIIYDWTTHAGLRRGVSYGLLLLGLGFAAYGFYILAALV
jgi:succinate dehydrogenase/fumarate reductase cytochrome b subunit